MNAIWYLAASATPGRSAIWRNEADVGKDDKAAEVYWSKSPGSKMAGMTYPRKVDGYVVDGTSNVGQGPPYPAYGDGVVLAQTVAAPVVVKPAPAVVKPAPAAARVCNEDTSFASFGLFFVGLLTGYGISKMRGKK